MPKSCATWEFSPKLEAIHASTTCISTLLPLAGSVLMRRRRSDRPLPVPGSFANDWLLGQYVELPNDVAFTTEYAVRGAREVVAEHQDTGRPPPPVCKGQFDPHSIGAALGTLRA